MSFHSKVEKRTYIKKNPNHSKHLPRIKSEAEDWHVRSRLRLLLLAVVILGLLALGLAVAFSK